MSKKNFKRVADASEVTRKPRSSPTSKWASEIEEILTLEPPQGLLLPVPPGKKDEAYRRSVRAMVDKHILPNSPFRFRVSIAKGRQILVSCQA